LLLNADGSKLVSGEIHRRVRYLLSNFVTRSEKELGAAGLPLSEEVELSTELSDLGSHSSRIRRPSSLVSW
jgi:hypothetical protein